jgi:hypothetical protein
MLPLGWPAKRLRTEKPATARPQVPGAVRHCTKEDAAAHMKDRSGEACRDAHLSLTVRKGPKATEGR